MSEAASALGFIGPGVNIFALTNGQFSLIDAIQHVLEHTGRARLDLATWTAADADFRRANAMLQNGNIDHMRLLIDPSFRSRKPEFCAAAVEIFGNDAIRTIPIHAKFCVIDNGDWPVVIRTSMNMNPNRRIESLEIANDPDLAAFLQGFCNDVFKRSPAENFKSQGKGMMFETPARERLAF